MPAEEVFRVQAGLREDRERVPELRSSVREGSVREGRRVVQGDQECLHGFEERVPAAEEVVLGRKKDYSGLNVKFLQHQQYLEVGAG